MQSVIDRIFDRNSRTMTAQANAPFLLNGQDVVWWIESGQVEIFAVTLTDGQPVGVRNHMFTAATGRLLFGMSGADSNKSTGFLAVGNTDTRLKCLPTSAFRNFLHESDFATAVIQQVDQWVQSFSISIRADLHDPSDMILEGETQVVLPVDTRACARKGVVWIRLDEGHATFLGLEDVPVCREQLYFPLADPAWIQTATPVTLTIVSGWTAYQSRYYWSGLDLFHQMAGRCQEIERNLAAADAHNLLKERESRDSSRMSQSLVRLTSVGERRKTRQWPHFDSAHPLLTACCMVGDAIGISIVAPSGPQVKNDEQISLDDIVRASHIRIRQVTLQGKWWKHDSEALLGFAGKQEKPVALLPMSSSKYLAVDPQTRTRQVIDQEVANSLSPNAYKFYRRLPNRSLTPWDVAGIGIHGCAKDILSVALTGILGALLGVMTPIVTALIFDNVIPEASRSRLIQIVCILLICTIGATLLEMTKSISVLRLKGKIDPTVEAAVVDRLISLPVFFFRRYSSGDLANRSMGICTISQSLSEIILQAVLGCAFSSVNLILLFWYEWRLALVAVGLSMLSIIFGIVSSILQIRYQRLINDIEGHISGMLLQLISGIAKLRVANAEDRAFVVWANDYSKKRRLIFKSRTIQNSLDTFNTAYPIVISMIIFYWVMEKSAGAFTTGSFVAFNAAFLTFQLALLQMSTVLTSIMNAAPYYERAKPIFSALPEVDENKGHPGQLSGDIEVSQVSFRYDADGPLILNNISLTVKSGEFLAIVGGSGSGKSTLLRLLLGFERPETGAVFYDRQDLALLDIREVRRQIGVVLQNGSIMPGSIFRNIVGSADLSIEDAWEAAKMAGLDQDISEMPLGMMTMISFGGGSLSGGQRQRLMIARAIVRKPRILFFDEATSALDNRTQAIVSNSLNNLRAARVVIAHRLSTIIHADRIVVMAQGHIVETGTYEELIDQDGPFAQLAKRQIA